MMTDESVSETDEAAQTETPTEDGVQSTDNDALDSFQAEQERFAQEKAGNFTQKKEDTDTPEPKVETQPTEKDTRHFSKKINEEVDKRVKLAKGFLEKDPEYIYELAAEDPDVADRILKMDGSYEARSSKELLKKKDLSGEGVTKVQLDHDERLADVEATLREERINRLKEKNPDLEGEMEEKFRELYSDPALSKKYDITDLLGFARALHGKSSPSPQNDVALALLRQQEGVTPSVRGGGSAMKDVETSESKRLRAAFGHSKSDEKLLPPNWKQLIGN